MLAAFFCFSFPAVSQATEYLSESAFLQQQFGHSAPPANALWLTGQLQKTTADVLQHKPSKLRQRYWAQGQRSVWIMEEVGKEKPITVGIVINQGAIEKVEVLAFRESRGWEIRYPFFTQQYTQAKLGKEQQLDKHIDNITGATLSVRAVNKLARLALIYHAQVFNPALPATP